MAMEIKAFKSIETAMFRSDNLQLPLCSYVIQLLSVPDAGGGSICSVGEADAGLQDAGDVQTLHG